MSDRALLRAGRFLAWFEVWLRDRWWTFDAHYYTPRIDGVLMVRGRDAADGAMMTSFGSYDLTGFKVWTDEVAAGLGDEALARLLETPSTGPALIPPPAADARDRFGLPACRMI